MGYLLRHLQVFFQSLGSIIRNPLPTVLTILVLGVTLALPAGLYLLTHNLKILSEGWQGKPQATIYLKKNSTLQDKSRLESWFATRSDWIISHNYVSAEQALQEFTSLSSMDWVLALLDSNPLPEMFEIKIVENLSVDHYKDELNQLENDEAVDDIKFDLQWVQRLQTILDLIERSVWTLAGLLGLGVVLIISNTMRMSISNRTEEILIINRVGGTDAFIRRPFLYTGFLLGLFGGVVAWLILSVTFYWLNQPIERLSQLYASDFKLQSFPTLLVSCFLISSGILGWLASWFTVSHHIKKLYKF